MAAIENEVWKQKKEMIHVGKPFEMMDRVSADTMSGLKVWFYHFIVFPWASDLTRLYSPFFNDVNCLDKMRLFMLCSQR